MNLRILSYNIHRAIGVDRRFRPERIATILAHHDADIVLLQEVDVGVPRSQGMDLAQELAERPGYPHHALGLNVQLREGMYGNATLSRYPIVKERNIDLTIESGKARGCLYTGIAMPAKTMEHAEIAVFNLHLGLSFKERPRQIGMLVRSDECRALGLEDSCLVGGDLNDWQTRLAPIFTEILEFECATNHGWGYQKSFLTYPSLAPRVGLYKIFCRGALEIVGCRRCRLRVSKVASYHLPVIADIKVKT